MREESPTERVLARNANDAKDKAIEFARYLADAAEQFMAVMCQENPDPESDEIPDALKRLKSAVYEFRKRERRTLS